VVSARLDLVTLKIPEGTETLLTIIPSNTKSGSALALIERHRGAEPALRRRARRRCAAVGARHFPLQRRIYRLRRGFGDIFGSDGGNGDPEIAPLGREARPVTTILPPAPGKGLPEHPTDLLEPKRSRRDIPGAQLDRQRPGGRVGMLNVPSEAVVADSVVPSMVIVTPAARRRS